MNPVERQAQRETDSDILAYVREMQQHARVLPESIHGFLTNARRRKVTSAAVLDRLTYLTSAGFLKLEKEWEGGEIQHYTITALGMDLLDGEIPPPNWKP